MATTPLPTPVATPASSKISATDKEAQSRKPKGYKRIKFKTWKPDVPPGSDEQNQSGTYRWRVTTKAKKAADHEQESELAVRTKYSYRYPSPMDRSPANGHRQDPFVTLPIEATATVTSALDFFLATCVPMKRNSEWPLGRPNPHMSMLFPFMLKEPMLFETIVALCRTSILLSQGKKVEEDSGFIYHRARAIKAVTKNLTTPDGVSDASMLSIAMILTLEYLIGNVAAVAAHLGGIQRMLDMRTDLDGSTEWKRFVKAGIIEYQSMGSFVTGIPMPVPGNSPGFIAEAFAELDLDSPLNYPTVPFAPDLCVVLARLPPGFAELCLSGAISAQAMKFLAFANATTAYSESITEMDVRLDHEVQAMFSAIQRMSLMQPTSLESRVLCGLLAYAFQLRQLKPLNLFHDPPLRRFVNFLGNHEKSDSSRAQETMIWVSIAAAGALKLRSIKMPGSLAVLERMFHLYPATVRWNYVESILKAHFWTSTIGEHWRKTWEEGLEHWRVVEKRKREDGGSVQLSFPGVDSLGLSMGAADGVVDDVGVQDGAISMEEMTAYARGAAHDMAQMMEASVRCPFRSRMGPTMEGTEGMMQPTCPIMSHV